MKNIFTFIAAVLAFSSIIFTGCTDLLTPDPSNPIGSGNQNSNVKVSIISPTSDDSISYGNHEVLYTVTPSQGINFFELHVNGKFSKYYPANPDGSKPKIMLSIDSSKINTKISFFLVYFDKDNSSATSNTVSNLVITEDRNPPFEPYNLSITPIGNTSVNIAWKDSSKGEVGYEIYRRDGFFGDYVLRFVAPPKTFNLNDNNLDLTNTVYYYYVRSVNKYGKSAPSKTVNTSGVGTSGNILPPTNLSATVVSTSTSSVRVDLTWTDNSNNENIFKIERRTSWSAFETIGSVGPNIEKFSDSKGVVMGLEYFYRIKAFSSTDSSWSNTVSVVTNP